MKINSLGIKTDLMFLKQNAMVEDRGDYILVRSPDNPEFFWGNFLIFPEPPQKGDFKQWQRHFENEFAKVDGIEHMTFEWDHSSRAPQLDEFRQNGFEYEETVVLVAKDGLHPMYENHEISMMRVETNETWHQLVEFQIEVNPDGYPEDSLRPFVKKRFQDYRDYSEAGLGHWYAAFLDGKMVADLGLYSENGVARYQNIKTHRDYRKQGIAQTLMHFAASDLGADYFVIQAEDHGPAINMYQSIGFEALEVIAGLCRYDQSKW